jgi:hypothetical protein
MNAFVNNEQPIYLSGRIQDQFGTRGVITRQLKDTGYVVVQKPEAEPVANHLIGLESILGRIDGSHKHADKNGFVRLTTDPASHYDTTIRRPQSDSGHQSPHTDGAFRSEPPAYITLHCLTPAPDGGGINIIVPGQRIFDFLREEFGREEFLMLFRPDIYTVLRGDESQDSAVFHGTYEFITRIVYSVHEYNRNVINPMAKRMFDALHTFLHDESNLDYVALRAGETLIVDNFRALHGRTQWHDRDGRYRDMLRVWYQGLR